MRTFVYLWLPGLVLCWLAWTFGYYLLPEGALRGAALSAEIPIEALGVWQRAATILGWNVAVCLIFIAGANLLWWVSLPLGYVPVVYFWVLYGLLLGTNSFGVPMPEQVAPDVATFLQRAGFYEITAYTLVAAATARWARWRQTGWLSGSIKRLAPGRLSTESYVMFAVALSLLVFSALREAAALPVG